MYSKQEQDGCPGTNGTLTAVCGVCGKVLGVEGCRGGLCEKQQGLPVSDTASPRWFHPAPMDPP